MRGHRGSRPSILLLGLTASAAVAIGARADGPTAPAQPAGAAAAPQGTVVSPAETILSALQANPMTAPYRFAVRSVGRQYSLSGRVGTKLVHDAAIRTVIALGYPVRDDLTIDTTVAVAAASLAGPMGGAMPYVYPPPLFGRLDDPFYGFEPPLVTYPPFANAVAAREPIGGPVAMNTVAAPAADNAAVPPATAAPVPSPAAASPAPAAGAPGAAAAAMPGSAVGEIQMTLDQQGVAVLRGRVASLADRVAIGQEVARVPGISQVVNLLDVIPPGAATPPARDRDTPPPPPTPANVPAPRPPSPARPADAPDGKAADRAPVAPDGEPVSRLVNAAIARRPALAGVDVRVAAADGVVTLTGHAPSAYEAMLAFRAAQQTPGARDVIDKMEFPLPDPDRPNPLRTKGRPEDVEPYLLAQVRRQVGDLAHVESVRLRGDTLEVRGTVARADDTPRAEAALRSVPLLRGFRLEPTFVAE